MTIDKIKILNFKCFQGTFELNLNDKINIIVGNNESGKSTIFEAIHLALSGMFNGRSVKNEISQYLFNEKVVNDYLNALKQGDNVELPHILIEIYFKGKEFPLYEGTYNSNKVNAQGLSFKIAFDEKYKEEYELLIKTGEIKSLPIEYYDVYWTTFAREIITPKTIPIKSAMIDSSSNRYQNGSDVYISRIVKDLLEIEDVTHVAQAHRKMREGFMCDPSITSINEKINQDSTMINKKIELSVELGTKNAWENSLVTQLDNIPFHFIGKGEQCIVKTELALSNKKTKDASIILIEEPESHLSHTRLNQLISCIKTRYSDKQIIISTHSSFVANKLGLDKLILLNNFTTTKFENLESKTFFERISGYDTLRLILCDKAILVEGDSDELVIQKAFMCKHSGKLPIEEGIDVISVGTSFLRFLEISDRLKKPVVVVTDNDGDLGAIKEKYKDYIGENAKPYANICFDSEIDEGNLLIGVNPYNYNTLEPKFLKSNSLQVLNSIFGTNYAIEDDLRKYMKHNKTECALKIFETKVEIKFPEYIQEAVK